MNRFFLAFTFTISAQGSFAQNTSPEKGLKDHYKDFFPIGVAVSPQALKTDEAQLILQQFNSITAENAMKMGPIHPKENEYFWTNADSIVVFAQRNKLKLRGHTLCWHNQTPSWLFVDSEGKPVSKEVLLKRLKDHITTVAGRYEGKIYAWDVVNEAISDKPDEYLRNNEFYKICGEEYIAKAFQFAHEADPNALLFYNDYNEINPVKREKIFKLVKSLKDSGVPVHGVGLQGHWALNEPSRHQLDSTLTRFSELGLKIQITELDISVYPKEHHARERKAEDYNTIFNEEMETKQTEVYKMCFELFRKHRSAISGITFWNISDRHSWLDNFPVKGRKDYPLLFDKELKPKKSFWEVVKIEVPPARQTQDSLRKISEQDHWQLMDRLGITSLRQGANGSDPNAPNVANYDEAKANPFPSLPDPLQMKNGKKVKSEKMWWGQRRPEIAEDFDREIYGRMPKGIPAVKWEVVSTTQEKNGDVPVIIKKLIGHVDNSSHPSITVDIQMTLTTPANATGPVPVMMEFSWVFPPGFRPPVQSGQSPTAPSWQQQVLAKGWGFATLPPTSFQADNGAGLTRGIIGLVNKGQPRKPDDWGTLRAWAWGAGRALDYFETDAAVDSKQVGITGHSRYGKAAAVAMAYDARFAITFISSSGAGGLKLHRRNYGEIVENVAAVNEYHWMAGNYIKYAGPLQWSDLPIDSHELVAMCAPRPVFISNGGKGDGWADAKGMFMAGVHAGPVYKLLGKKDLGTTEFPPLETALIDGEIAFRQHSGGHTQAPNWPTFLTFAERYMRVKNIKTTTDK